MAITDGKIERKGEYINSTRFDEMMQSINRSFRVCSRANIKSRFISFVNGDPVDVGATGHLLDPYNLDQHFRKLFYTPEGGTPLYAKLSLIHEQLKHMDISNGMRRKIIIFTDGEPSDCCAGVLVFILKEIVKYNCSITIRLCTDDSSVVRYWDSIDKDVEFALDIIDDYRKEKKVVKKLNPDLKYKYPLHSLREFGLFQSKFDRMDENKLSELDVNSINSLYDVEVHGCC